MDYAAKPTKVFTRDYKTDDTGQLVESGRQWEKSLVDEMKDSGYARVLDLDMKQYVSYDEKQDLFTITYVLHGIFVGKKKAWTVFGIRDGQIVADIPRTK